MRRAHAVLAALCALCVASASRANQELGLNVHQSTSVGLDVTHDAGLRWVRVDLNWDDAEATQGAPDFTLFDTIVDGASARGLSVLAVLAYTPAWASSGDTMVDGALNDVPIDGAYAAFVTEVVNHFQGRIDHYELWNEPNLQMFFEGTADDYVTRILAPGADALHAACPTCKVVAPAVATVGSGYDTFLDSVLTAAQDKIDVVSGHDYAGFPDMGSGASSDSFYNKLDNHRVIELDGTIVYQGPLSFKEVLDAHGTTAPFWITETGYSAAPNDTNALALQATYYRHVLEAMLHRPWWTTTIFYEAFDEPGSGYTTGITVHDGTPPHDYSTKPAFDLLKHAALAQPAFGGTLTDCSDGLDNDGDGLIDYPADPGCSGPFGPTEGKPEGGGGAGSVLVTTGVGGAGVGGTGGASSSPTSSSHAGGKGAHSTASGESNGAAGGGGAGGDSKEAGGSGCGCEVAGAGDWGGALVAIALALAAQVRKRRAATRPSRWV